MRNPIGLLGSKCSVQQQYTSAADLQSPFIFEQKYALVSIVELWFIWVRMLGGHPPTPQQFLQKTALIAQQTR